MGMNVKWKRDPKTTQKPTKTTKAKKTEKSPGMVRRGKMKTGTYGRTIRNKTRGQ